MAPYDCDTEVAHARTCAYGNAEGGVKLNLLKRRMYLSILKLIHQHLAPPASILDVGCSFGGFLEQAQIQGFTPRGMDIVPEAVEYVRQQGIPCDRAASIAQTNLPNSSMAIISVLDCNYYWPDQRAELHAAWGKLRPSGILVMRLVDKSWMLKVGLALNQIFPALSAELCGKAVNDHRVSIPISSMLRVLQQEGFEILQISIWDAVYSDSSSPLVKAVFAFGTAIWSLTGRYMAPGAVVIARKSALAQTA